MRIISPFHDYYDCIQSYGHDPYPLYLREQKEVSVPTLGRMTDHNELFDKISSVHSLFEIMPRTNSCYSGAIILCEKAYPFYQYYKGDELRFHDPSTLKTFYDIPKLIDALSKDKHQSAKNDVKDFRQTKAPTRTRRKYAERYRYRRNLNPHSWNRFTSELKEVPAEIHRHFNSPVFAISLDRNVKMTINPCLKDYHFQQVMQPFEVFQEISMYLGNKLVSQMDPNPPISDELKAQSKGFDKYSFRKEKKQ
jgi:hypothetical protein